MIMIIKSDSGLGDSYCKKRLLVSKSRKSYLSIHCIFRSCEYLIPYIWCIYVLEDAIRWIWWASADLLEGDEELFQCIEWSWGVIFALVPVYCTSFLLWNCVSNSWSWFIYSGSSENNLIPSLQNLLEISETENYWKYYLLGRCINLNYLQWSCLVSLGDSVFRWLC